MSRWPDWRADPVDMVVLGAALGLIVLVSASTAYLTMPWQDFLTALVNP